MFDGIGLMEFWLDPKLFTATSLTHTPCERQQAVSKKATSPRRYFTDSIHPVVLLYNKIWAEVEGAAGGSYCCEHGMQEGMWTHVLHSNGTTKGDNSEVDW
jgi:hypothetical protein